MTDDQVAVALQAFDKFAADAVDNDGTVEVQRSLDVMVGLVDALRAAKGTVLKVVTAHELENATRDGWTLVQILHESDVVDHYHTAPHPRAGQQMANDGSYGPTNPETVNVTTPMTTTHQAFLLRKDRETILLSLQADCAAAFDTIEIGAAALKAANDEVAKGVVIIGEQRTQATARDALTVERQIAYEKMEQLYAAHVDETKGMQLQFDKVREAVGTIEWEKIMSYQDSKHDNPDVTDLPDAEEPFD